MENPDQVVELIASLTPMEIQYFRKYARLHTIASGNRYLALFEDLTKGRKPKAAVAASSRNYLQSILLRALRSFHAQSSATMELHALLDTLEIIFLKRQIKLAARLVARGLLLAAEIGEPAIVLAFCKWQRRLLRRQHAGLTASDLEPIQLQEEIAIHDLQQEVKAIQLHDEIFSTQRKGGTVVAAEALKQLDAASFDGAIALETAMGFAAQNRRDEGLALQHFLANVEIWCRFPRRIQDHPRRFTAALVNYLGACHKLSRFDEFEKVMQRIQALPFRDRPLKLEIELQCQNLLLVLHLNSYDLTAAGIVVDKLQALRDSRGKSIDFEQAVQYNIAMYFFLSGQARSALKHLAALIQVRRSLAKPERRDAARVFELLVFIDLGQEDLAATRLRSLLRMQSKLSLPKWALPILRQLALVLKVYDARRHHCYTDMLAQMETFQGSKGLVFEEMLLWLKAKVLRTDLTLLVAAQASERSRSKMS
jgi:hypothetical protein